MQRVHRHLQEITQTERLSMPVSSNRKHRTCKPMKTTQKENCMRYQTHKITQTEQLQTSNSLHRQCRIDNLLLQNIRKKSLDKMINEINTREITNRIVEKCTKHCSDQQQSTQQQKNAKDYKNARTTQITQFECVLVENQHRKVMLKRKLNP